MSGQELQKLVKLRAEHTIALDVLQLARAKLELAQAELIHYEGVAVVAELRLKEALKAANQS